MRRLSLLVLILTSVLCVEVAQAKDGDIVARHSVTLPAFSSDKEIALYADASEYQAAVVDKKFKLERIEYVSDGLTVSAYLYRPTRAAKFPVIIFNRGGYIVPSQAPSLLTMFRRLAQQGFIVIAPMLRGSDNTNGTDSIGGDDLHDIANIFPVLRHLEFADPENIFMYGESRGGVMTLLSIRARMPIKAAATFGAITDMPGYFANDPRVAAIASKVWPGFEQHKQQVLDARSAQKWADEIRVPILLMHGAKDKQVPPIQTLKLAEQLQAAGNDYGVIIYPGDNHILSRHREDRDRQVVTWFKSFIAEEEGHP